jgi:hypothetical protein
MVGLNRGHRRTRWSLAPSARSAKCPHPDVKNSEN